MKIQINKLKLNEGQVKDVPKNPRFIKDDKYEKLKKSLTEDPEFMDYNPVLIYDNNGELIVMGGNMRVRAAKELGWKEINGEVMPYDTPAQTIRARIIKHNSGYGSDDWDLLANEWSDDPLPDWGLDVPNDWNQSEVVEDEAPGVSSEPSKSKLGEIYQLGRHRVACMDSTVKENVEQLMDGVKADMVFTDPPYGVNYGADNDKLRDEKGDRAYHWSKSRENHQIKGDDKGANELAETLWRPSFANMYEVAKDDCSFYMTMCQGGDQMMMMMMMSEKWQVKHELIWDKGRPVFSMGRLNYDYQHEPILFGWKKKHNFYGKGKFKTSVWQIDKAHKSDLHPTMKPIELIANALSNSSKKNDNILDLFLGSGSTLIACEQTDRTCYGMELDPKYCDVTRKRYWKFVNENNEEGWENGTPTTT